MKNTIFSLVVLSITSSCGTQPTVIPEYSEPLKVAQYESGDKDAGLINLSLSFKPGGQKIPVDNEGTIKYVNGICQNWGYSYGNLVGGNVTGKCISFNFNNGDCLRYKVPISAVCKK